MAMARLQHTGATARTKNKIDMKHEETEENEDEEKKKNGRRRVVYRPSAANTCESEWTNVGACIGHNGVRLRCTSY